MIIGNILNEGTDTRIIQKKSPSRSAITHDNNVDYYTKRILMDIGPYLDQNLTDKSFSKVQNIINKYIERIRLEVNSES
jgi:hypothetical protein